MTRPTGRSILHIGRHKSGTTAIQNHLASNSALLSECGYDYPEAGRQGQQDHAPLAWTLNDATRAGRRLVIEGDASEAFDQHVSDSKSTDKTMVVSSEVFQSVDPQSCLRWFAAEETTVAVYVREQYDYLVSGYIESVAANTNTQTLEQFFQEKEAFGFWSHKALLDRWTAVFEDVRVRRYERASLPDGDVVLDFCAEFLPRYEGRSSGAANIGIGGDLLEFKRSLNELVSDRYELDGWAEILRATASVWPEYRIKPTVEPSLIEGFRSRFLDSNKAVAERFFGESQLFAPSKLPANKRPVEPLNQAQHSLVLERIHAQPSGPEFIARFQELAKK